MLFNAGCHGSSRNKKLTFPLHSSSLKLFAKDYQGSRIKIMVHFEVRTELLYLLLRRFGDKNAPIIIHVITHRSVNY